MQNRKVGLCFVPDVSLGCNDVVLEAECKGRLIAVHVPLGFEQVEVEEVHGCERIAQSYHVRHKGDMVIHNLKISIIPMCVGITKLWYASFLDKLFFALKKKLLPTVQKKSSISAEI